MKNSAPSPHFTLTGATGYGDQAVDYHVYEVPRWYTVAETADRCHRAPRTVLNIISKFGLPIKAGWVTRRRKRRKVILLRPEIVQWIVEVTLLGNYAARERPPR